jgi:hypothetical protein
LSPLCFWGQLKMPLGATGVQLGAPVRSRVDSMRSAATLRIGVPVASPERADYRSGFFWNSWPRRASNAGSPAEAQGVCAGGFRGIVNTTTPLCAARPGRVASVRCRARGRGSMRGRPGRPCAGASGAVVSGEVEAMRYLFTVALLVFGMAGMGGA